MNCSFNSCNGNTYTTHSDSGKKDGNHWHQVLKFVLFSLIFQDGHAVEKTPHGTLSYRMRAIYQIENRTTGEQWEFWTGEVDNTIISTFLMMIGAGFHKRGSIFHGKTLQGKKFEQNDIIQVFSLPNKPQNL